MKKFRFIHCADLHLDSPFQGLLSVSPAIRERMKDAALQALDRVIDAAVKERVAFVLFAGDVYDAADRSIRAQIRFRRALERLDRHGIGAYVVWGNHDPADGYRAVLDWPPNVKVFGTDAVERVIASDADGDPVAEIAGISYPTMRVTENLSARFPREAAQDGLFRIGLLHANVGGSREHGNYAPCTLTDLTTANIDYWALGHIHQRVVLHEKPWVVYPGNVQGRHAKESGAKGFYLVDVDELGHAELTFVAADSVRWERLTLSIDGLSAEQELFDALQGEWDELAAKLDGRSAFVRIAVTGSGPLHGVAARPGWADEWLAGLRDELAPSMEDGAQAAFLWPERVEIAAEPAWDWDELKQADHFLGELLRLADRLPGATDEASEGPLRPEALPEWMQSALRPMLEHQKLAALLGELPATQASLWRDKAVLQAAARLSGIAEGSNDAN